MRIINKDELKHNPKLVDELKNSIFVYPTDTIYGVGCDAANPELVAKIREMKGNPSHPFSIIIPNKNMIYEFCETNEQTKEWIDKLPGPYTLIFKVKKKFVADNVNPGNSTIGIRIPHHWFYNYVKKMKIPVITTSANITGGVVMTNVDNLDPEIENQVDFVIEDGEHKGRPSTIVNLAEEEVEVRER